GSFTVHEAQYAPDGTLWRFYVSFEQHSEGGVPALTGELAYTLSPAGVLVNDQDANGDALTARLVTGPAHGTLDLRNDGSFVYRPNVNFVGADSFTYQASDGIFESNVATVTLIVAPPANSAPVASDDAFAVDGGETLTITSVPGGSSLHMV